jgi:hypothetical protein
LIHRNAGVEVAGHFQEDLMSVAQQALLLTGELFVLSFVAIFAFWFADRLRRNFTGKA